MLEPKVQNIVDSVLDYTAIKKKYGLTTETRPNIETHTAKVKLVNWLSELINLFRIVMMDYISTKRLTNVEINTTDERAREVIEEVKNRCRLIKFARGTPTGNVRLHVDGQGSSPLIDVNAKNFSGIGNFVTPVVICQIASGHTMTITADVELNNYAITKFRGYTFLHNFDRSKLSVHNEEGVDFEELTHIGDEYNSGELTFRYQENISATKLWKEAGDYIVSYIEAIARGVAEEDPAVFTFARDTGIIILNNDSNEHFAKCIMAYWTSLDRDVFVSTGLVPPSASSLRVSHLTQPVLKKSFAEMAKVLVKHIS